MVCIALLVFVLALTGVIVICKIEGRDNPDIKLSLHFTGFLYITMILSIITIFSPKEKSHLEYLRGNLEVKYEKVYVDSVLVRTDTIIEFKKR